MAARIRHLLSLFLLSITITVCFADPLDATVNDGAAYGKVSANINKLFDSMLPAIRNFILKKGLDPMQLEDISEDLQGIIIHKRVLNLTNGWLQGISDVKRANDVILSYEDKVLSLDAILGLDVLDMNYEYLFKDSLITRKGEVHGRVKNAELRVVLTVDMNRYKIDLRTTKIVRIGKLDVKLEGHVIDPVLNVAIKAITTLFRTKVTSIVEKRCFDVLQGVVDMVNTNIPQPDIKEGNYIFNYAPSSSTLRRI